MSTLEERLASLHSGGMTELRTPAKTMPIERPTPEAGPEVDPQ